jgi:hypothetical protein
MSLDRLSLNRYEKENAAERIYGYYLPRPEEVALGNQVRAFERAKAETLMNLRAVVAQTEALTAEQFFSIRRITQGITEETPKREDTKE